MADAARNRGVIALFAGPDKTAMRDAAAMLSRELGVDVQRVDLGQIVSKYIGETEKNLERLLDAASRADVVLYFDEADALLGKRADVADSHDRYANQAIDFLLQRVETFRGVLILATNRRDAVDQPMARRFHYLVEFP
jgi:SpoVK/Ycf46/Vps4 family AAA+-type ATPase